MLKNGQKWFKKYVSKYVQIFKVCLVIFLVITHERVKAHYLVKSTHEFSCEMPIFWRFFRWYVMLCTISYLIHNLKNVKSTHGGVLILVKLQGLVAGFTFLKFFKWYKIVQGTTYNYEFWITVIRKKWFPERGAPIKKSHSRCHF